MTRAWLILGDILVTLLLLLSFILFYLYPPKEEIRLVKIHPLEHNITLPLQRIPLPDTNYTMTVEDLIRMAQQSSEAEYTAVPVFRDVPLKESLNLAHAKAGDPVFIRIFKREARLEVWIKVDGVYRFLKAYKICAYSGKLGPKRKEGDRQAPEGFYRVNRGSLNPNSKFHLSFNLGYPNAYDRAHGWTGSYLMVHGNCVSIGCYAMTDAKIEEIYMLVEEALKKGQRFVQVHIYPFRMTEENMAAYSHYRWYDFWQNLKEGYDYFEAEHLPPKITVKEKRYKIMESDG
jgi:murein L,D-transpeptidase YafK